VEAGPGSRRWLDEVLRAPAGLHTDPDVVDPTAAAYVAELATIALTVDLLSHDASHDALTGLLNRRSYEEALADAVARNRRYGWPFALVMIDLDNFKVINDRHGHAAGDDALRSLGVELRAILRTGDVAARLGGDEFALIILNAESPETLEPLTERLRSALDRGVAGAKLDFSAGVACFPTDSEDIVHLQRLADQRLYADKGSRG
jgi:diguanylate cyclase (GGDEF)-like protein